LFSRAERRLFGAVWGEERHQAGAALPHLGQQCASRR